MKTQTLERREENKMEKAYDIYVSAEDGSGRMIGVGSIRQEFIDEHHALAGKVLDELKAKGVEVHRVWLSGDGWGDWLSTLYGLGCFICPETLA